MTKLLAIAVVFLSFEHSAQATASSSREPLDRDNGNIEQIAGEYHGEKDPKNWGPRTKAYIARVMNENKNVAQTKKSTEEGFSPVEISNIYNAYQSGAMPQDAVEEFEADVKSGVLKLPKGATLKKNSQENSQNNENFSPSEILNIYNAYQSGAMPQDAAAEFEADVKSGLIALPKGATLKNNSQENLSVKSGETTLAAFAKAALGMLVAGIEGAAKFISNLFKGLQSQDDNAKAVYGDQTGLPVNCRAYVQATIDSYRQHQYSADDAFAGLERNCGLYGAIWKENRDKD